MVELSPYPHAKLCPSGEDSKTLADVTNCPALEVEFVDSVDGLRRESCFKALPVVPRVSALGYSRVVVGLIFLSFIPILLNLLLFRGHLIFSIPRSALNFVILVNPVLSYLCIV